VHVAVADSVHQVDNAQDDDDEGQCRDFARRGFAVG
jgi:hypothetical protein